VLVEASSSDQSSLFYLCSAVGWAHSPVSAESLGALTPDLADT
jgi:hypothetical protein